MKTKHPAKSEWTVLQNLPFAKAGEILINENGKWRKPIPDGHCMEDYSDFLNKITNIESFGNTPYYSEFLMPTFVERFSVPSIVDEVLEKLQYGDFHGELNEISDNEIKKEIFTYEIFRSLLKKAGINETIKR